MMEFTLAPEQSATTEQKLIAMHFIEGVLRTRYEGASCGEREVRHINAELAHIVECLRRASEWNLPDAEAALRMGHLSVAWVGAKS